MPRFRRWTRVLSLLMFATLAGCAALPAERGMPEVGQLVAARGGQQVAAPDKDSSALVADLLRLPLNAATAVRVALLNNPRVRAEYARLGIASAEVYDAGRLSNPRLSVASLASNISGEVDQVGFGLVQSFTDLLLLPARQRLAAGEFERAKEQAGQALLELATEVEVAYDNLVALQQLAALRVAVSSAAQASADLAQRFFDAGNLSARELAQQQAASAAARVRDVQATSELQAARASLQELLGLAAGTDQWHTENELAAPLGYDEDISALQALALQARLDLAAQRREIALLNDALTTAMHFRYVGAVEVGAQTERETDRSRITGPTLSVELPVFNQGAGKLARAQGLLEQAQSALATLQLTIEHKVRLHALNAAAARVRAEQLRTRLIPARVELVKRTQQEVSFMLEGQFRLLEVKQQEYEAYQGYIEAVRDYWVARAELARAVGTRLPVATTSSAPATTPATPADHQHPGGAP